MIELRCNNCLAQFPEVDAIDDECCPTCGCDSLFERETVMADEIESIPVHCIVHGHQPVNGFCSRCGTAVELEAA